MRLIIAFLLFTIPALAQDARVLPLSPVDAQTAKAKYEALQKAQKDWDDFQEKIKQDYLVVPKGDPEAGNEVLSTMGRNWLCGGGSTGTLMISTSGDTDETKAIKQLSECEAKAKIEDEKNEREHPTMYRRAGWENGAVFTKDFRFLVPKPSPEIKIPSGSTYYNFTPGVAW